ncbi:MAG: DUF998 domain-containing protein [Solirubrobacteraceae bacterium]
MIIRMRLRAGAAIPGRLSTHPLCPPIAVYGGSVRRPQPGRGGVRDLHPPLRRAKALLRANPGRESPTIIHGAPVTVLTVAMLLLSAGARVLIPIFPTDQDGSRFQTLTGTIHMVLAVAIFASIVVAASNLGGTLGHEPAWHAVKGLVDGWLPWVITITAIATGVAMIGPRLQRIFGLIERSYYASSITWFFIVSIELARIGK